MALAHAYPPILYAPLLVQYQLPISAERAEIPPRLSVPNKLPDGLILAHISDLIPAFRTLDNIMEEAMTQCVIFNMTRSVRANFKTIFFIHERGVLLENRVMPGRISDTMQELVRNDFMD